MYSFYLISVMVFAILILGVFMIPIITVNFKKNQQNAKQLNNNNGGLNIDDIVRLVNLINQQNSNQPNVTQNSTNVNNIPYMLNNNVSKKKDYEKTKYFVIVGVVFAILFTMIV